MVVFFLVSVELIASYARPPPRILVPPRPLLQLRRQPPDLELVVAVLLTVDARQPRLWKRMIWNHQIIYPPGLDDVRKSVPPNGTLFGWYFSF